MLICASLAVAMLVLVLTQQSIREMSARIMCARQVRHIERETYLYGSDIRESA